MRNFALLISLIFSLNVSCQIDNIAEKLGYNRDAKLLIIHGDDIGVSHSVNIASFDGYKNQRLGTPFFRTLQANHAPVSWKMVASILKNINKLLILKQSLVNKALFTKVVTFGQLFSKLAVVCSNSMSTDDLFLLKQK